MDKFEQYFDEFHKMLQEEYCLNLQENLKAYNFIYNAHIEKTPVKDAISEFAVMNHLIKKK